MASAPDRKYLGLFVGEAKEQLELLAGELVRLERAGGADAPPEGAQALWDSIFRRVHSVKGSAATLGLSQLVEVAHAAEALIPRLRAGRPERAQVDLLLEASDALARLVAEAALLLDVSAGDALPPASGAPLFEVAPLVGRLQAALAGLPAPPSAPPAERPANGERPAGPAVDPELPRWEVVVTLSAKCAAPGARAMIVQRKLKALGTLLEFDPPPAQLAQTRGQARLSALLATGRPPDEIRKACAGLPEVESVELSGQQGKVVAPQDWGAVDPPRPPEAAAAPLPAAHRTDPPRMAIEGEPRPEATVRVRAELLDQLLEAAGEVLGGIARLREGAKRLPEGTGSGFEHEIDRLRRQARELHNKVVNARLTPFSALTERLPRAVRDLAHKLGKEVELEIVGAEVELDRAVIEALGDPLSHLVRNGVDHGIEAPADRLAAGKPARGHLKLSARRERDKVFVDLEDDGRGVDGAALKRRAVQAGRLDAIAASFLSDDEAVELAFLAGVSTRAVATEVSGRGVGLDAVQRAIEFVGGKLSVSSKSGKGTRFCLELPRAVSMSNLLLVQVGGEVFGLPVQRVLVTTEYDLSARGGEGFESRSVIVGGQWVHAYGLAKLFGLPSLAPPGPRPFVVLQVDAIMFALSVDRLIGQEEAVVKPLFPPLDRVKGLAGVTVLGNGRPLLVLDPRGLSEMADVRGMPPLPPRSAANDAPEAPAAALGGRAGA